jgi:hypothetical protein
VGQPAASIPTLAPGASHGDEGDASFQGPAQDKELPALPKPTNKLTDNTTDNTTDKPTHSEADVTGSVIELTPRIAKPEAETGGQVTVRAKPEKRKNAKERAKERARAKGKLGATEEAAVAPEATSPASAGLATAHPKPEKRKNAKERAKEKYTKGRTTPDTTAKATSKVETKTKAKKTKAA